MANTVLLNSIDHKDLKVITERSESYGDNIWYALTFPTEYRSIQAHYPIFYQKDPNTGEFYGVALFGFKDKENLFIDQGKWTVSYIPLTVQRQPFLIGVRKSLENGVEIQQRMLHIDMDNPRVNTEKGEPLFLEYGGNTPFLDNAADMLEAIHHGLEDSKGFTELLIEHQLLESFTLDVELDSGAKHQMIGFYTINEDTLAALSSEVLAQLHHRGYLQAIYMMIASQNNIRDLLNRKNALPIEQQN